MDLQTQEIIKKWTAVLDHKDLPKIPDLHRRNVTAMILENTEKAYQDASMRIGGQTLLNEDAPTNNMGGGNISTFDPVLISLVRRTLPNLIAYDICGVQPMVGPTGIIFAMRSRYSNQTGSENFYNEVNTSFSSEVSNANTLGQKHVGGVPGISNNAANGSYNFGSAMGTANAEALGTANSTGGFPSPNPIPEMGFSVEKVTVTAKSRALKAEYSLELAQDLKAIHGLDAETELSNILSAELLAEINREIVRTVVVTAKPGAQVNTTTAGQFDLDTDSNGRWSVEKFKGLMFQIERECNQVAKDTRRGKGNIMICSSDVASALQMAGVLSYTPNMVNNLEVDDTGNTFAGIVNGRIRCYIDPYATGHYMVVGYKGASPFDAGLFYAPYVPLQMVRAVDPESFQPKIGFKTRYGIVANPFAGGANVDSGALTADENVFYRRVLVQNLL